MTSLTRRLPRALGYAIFLAATLTLSMRPAAADEIIMRDGSRLLGEVIGRDNSTLDFKTGYAGVIKIRWTEIAEITTEKPMELLLSDDSIVTGTHLTNGIDNLVVEDAAGTPPQTIAQDAVTLINPEPWRKNGGYKLSGRVNVALQKENGNTDQEEFDIDSDLVWRRKNDRFLAYGELERDTSEGRKIKDEWKLDGAYNYFVTKQWFWGGSLRLEHDQFADLDLRTSVGPLIGYQWFESKKMNLSTSTGLNYVNENFITESDNDYVALPWSVTFDRLMFDEFMQFYHRQTGLWNLTEPENVVWQSWTGFRFPLVLGLVASTELKVKYDGGAARDADNLDTTYSLKLGYQW